MADKTDYGRPAATALRLITKNGNPMTLVRADAGTFDPATGTTTRGADTTETMQGLILPAKTGKDEGLFPDGLVTSSRRKLLIAASGMTLRPAPVDVVQAAGVDWSIESVTPLEPDGVTTLIYTCGVKSGA